MEITLCNGIPAYAVSLSMLAGKANPHGVGDMRLATKSPKHIHEDSESEYQCALPEFIGMRQMAVAKEGR